MTNNFNELTAELAALHGLDLSNISAHAARLELSAKLARLGVDSDQFSMMLTHVSRVLKALNSGPQSTKVELEHKAFIKAARSALKSVDILVGYKSRLGDDRAAIIEVRKALETRIEAAIHVFEISYGKRSFKRDKKTFKRGRNSDPVRDDTIFLLVKRFEKIIADQNFRTEKGYSARSLTLLLFNAVGLDAKSPRGSVTEAVINKSFLRGEEAHRKIMSNDLAKRLEE